MVKFMMAYRSTYRLDMEHFGVRGWQTGKQTKNGLRLVQFPLCGRQEREQHSPMQKKKK